MKKILYIGNNLTKKTKYSTTMDLLANKFVKEGYNVIKTSNKLNKIYRLIDMCITLIKNRKRIDFILIDTFSTSNFYYALVTSQIARFFKLKYIPILHGGNLPERLKKNKKLSNLIFNNSYKNVAPSNYLKVAFEKCGYIVDFIPNTIEIKKYHFKERKDLKPYLLYVRAFDKLYNPTMAIYVLKKLLLEYPEAKLCMIGPDKDGSLLQCKTLAKQLKIAHKIEFTGVLTKEQWHKKSEDFDIFINTTNFDNTPVSVMEAMALGLPVVSTNVGGLPYLIDNDKDGVLVEKENIESMTNAIVKLLNNDERAFELAKNARKKVETFDWDTVNKQWEKLLNE